MEYYLERLTEKLPKEKADKLRSEYEFGDTYEDVFNCIKKLGHLEDIEEELGIDLATLFKALKEGFYFKEYDEIRKADAFTTKIRDDGKWYFDTLHEHSSEPLFLADYGKTWALTKEELENAE